MSKKALPPPSLPQHDYLTEVLGYNGFLSRAECKRVLALRQGPGKNAEIQNPNRRASLEEEVRKTLRHPIVPGPDTAWLSDRIMGLVQDLNQRCYQFRLTSLSSIDLLEYGPGGHYDWHIDVGKGEISTRKLSIVIFVSDPRDYDGGQLVMGPPSMALDNPQGSIVIFPSYLPHQVETVTRGKRFTLVCWANGKPFN